ncbi:Mysoin-binding motif of peroxisomes-domain-containing protein [Lipomyces starkeyi]
MASEHVVYNDSPLGEYLKAAGEDIATATELAEEWDPSAEPPTKFARFALSGVKHPTISNSSGPATAGKATRRTAVFHGSNTELKPLALGNERSMRKLRFQFLFAAPLKRRLSPRENSHFLERFRYVLVTSQLLDENVPISAFGRSDDNEGNLDSDFLDERNSKSKKGTRSDLGSGTRYWVGSGGCIVVVAVLFAWFFRGCDRLISGVGTKCKLLVGMVIGLSVSLFYYSHAWRKRLRTTRKTAMDCAAQFIKSNHLFDINMSRTIGIVQEVEFISRGFGIPGMPASASSSPLHSAFNRKSSSSSKLLQRKSPVGLRRCKALRNQISSALNLSLSLYTRSLDGLSELCNHSDLEKYFEIYDFNSPTAMQLEKEQRRNNEVPDVIDNGEDEADDESASMESLWRLKQQFRRLHHTRRKLLCCLLAMDARGDGSDFKKWRSVVQDVKTLSDLMKQLSDDLGHSVIQSDITELVEFYTKEQEGQNKQQELQYNRHPHKSVPSSQLPIQIRWRPHLQALNTISATLRNIEAKMYVLREDSTRLELQELRVSASPNKTPDRGAINMDSVLRRSGSGVGPTMDYSSSPSLQMSSDILVKQYNSIGADLKALVKDWESGKGKLYEAIAASGARSPGPSSLDRLYDGDIDSSPVSSVMSSPDSLISGTTFDSTSIPWSPQRIDEGRFLMRDLEDDGDDEREGDGSGLLLERDSDRIPMAAKSKMVENIASAMIRQQDRMLRSL